MELGGSPHALPFARAALSHSDEEVREGAVEALRAMRVAEAATLLNRALHDDVAPGVRMATARAMASRAARPHLGAVTAALRTEPDARVRAALVRMLGPLVGLEDAARSTLRDVASNDEAEDVRRLAAAFLDTDG
ncbi:HEAT repeat domain-containing protein [Myxococcus sp. K15C18031901]|nr:HEAT repeat domain-containing protein [Myxococcus dinghuensis]